jgi:hypothetical protein
MNTNLMLPTTAIDYLCDAYPEIEDGALKLISTVALSGAGYYSATLTEIAIALSLPEKHYFYMIPAGVLTAGLVGYMLPGGSMVSASVATLLKSMQWFFIESDNSVTH